MNWKDVKEFLKLDWRKIVIAVILGLISYFYGVDYCYMAPCPEGNLCPQICRTLANPLLWGPGCIFFGDNAFSKITSTFFGIIYWYLLSCLIVWIYGKLRKR